MNTQQLEHWQSIYRDKSEAQTSWFRPHLDESLRLIDSVRLPASTPVIDVGGGRSTLVDDLLARGFSDVSVLDIAEPALAASRARLGARAQQVHWLQTDILDAELPPARFGLWHDRAVFHFLVDAAARARYVDKAAQSILPGGHAVIATFAPHGPERCSGLPVARYDADALACAFQPAFECIASSGDLHRTPWGSEQAFAYVVLRRAGNH